MLTVSRFAVATRLSVGPAYIDRKETFATRPTRRRRAYVSLVFISDRVEARRRRVPIVSWTNFHGVVLVSHLSFFFFLAPLTSFLMDTHVTSTLVTRIARMQLITEKS